jgi:hypothetical protein
VGFLLRCSDDFRQSPFVRTNILCRERLTRLQAVLDRNGGACSIRDLSRTYGIREWEVAQAEEAGWVAFSERKPVVGRPSWVVLKLSETQSAKLPPWRNMIPHNLSIRHERFALESACVVPRRNRFGCGLQSATDAYLRAFPACKSRAAAAASASRLMKRPMIRAARLWFQRITSEFLHEPLPHTPEAVYRRIKELGL